MQAPDLLADLIAFPTVSANPTRALVDHCAALLRDAGAQVPQADGRLHGRGTADMTGRIGLRSLIDMLAADH